jgi:pimeloyl-ACP methyl ester carboxylesterase
VTDFWRMTYTSYAASKRDAHDYLERASLNRRLAATGVPLLVLYGARDRLVPPASMRAFGSVPGARIVAIPAAGHSPMVERPFATSRLILGFVRGLARPARPARAAA